MIDQSRKLRVDLIWSYSSMAILAVGGVILNLIIARFFGADALGVFNQSYACYIVASQFAVAGIHFSVLNKVSISLQPLAQARIVSSGLCAGAGLSLTVGLALYLAAPLIARGLQSPNMAVSLVWIAAAVIFFGLNKIAFSAFNGMRAIRTLSFLQAARYVLLITGVILIWQWEIASQHLSAVFLGAEAVLFMISMSGLLVFRLLKAPRIRLMGEHLHFGARGFLSGVFVELNTRVDVLVLGVFLGDGAVGIYSFAAMLAEGYYSLLVVIRNNLNPIIARLVADAQFEQLGELIRKTRRLVYPALLLFALVVLALFSPVVNWLVGDGRFLQGFWVLAILIAGIWTVCGLLPFEWILTQSGFPGYQTLLALITVSANVVLNFIAIPLAGIHGAACATAISFIIAGLSLVILVARNLRFDLLRTAKLQHK